MQNAERREKLHVMEKNTFQKVHEIIEQSSLSLDAKREFSELFARTKESALMPVLSLFERDAEWVEKLYENYRKKKDAFVTGSIDTWKETIETQREALEK